MANIGKATTTAGTAVDSSIDFDTTYPTSAISLFDDNATHLKYFRVFEVRGDQSASPYDTNTNAPLFNIEVDTGDNLSAGIHGSGVTFNAYNTDDDDFANFLWCDTLLDTLQLGSGNDWTVDISGDLEISRKFINGLQNNLTADAGSAQGGTPLTRSVNRVTTVATIGDSVTLPSAKAGLTVTIFNDGANSLDVFPATSNNINGGGVDTAEALAAGSKVTYIAYDSANWKTLHT